MLDGMKRRLLVGLCAIIILIILTPTASATSYVQTTYTDFIQGNGDGNIFFTSEGDGEIALSEQVGTAVGGFRLVGQLPTQNKPIAITAARGCLYLVATGDAHVYWAQITEDGSIRDWYASEPAPYPVSTRPGVTVIGDYICTTCVSDVLLTVVGELGPDGSVSGVWHVDSRDTQSPGYLRSMSGRLYGPTSERLQFSDLDADGTLCGWSEAAEIWKMYFTSLDPLCDRLYVLQNYPKAWCGYGFLGDSGTLGPVIQASGNHSLKPYTQSNLACGDCLLGFGGRWQNHTVMNCDVSLLGPNGIPQDRSNAPPLPVSLWSSVATHWQDNAYVAGGYIPSPSGQPDSWSTNIYAAKLIEDGVPSRWVETSPVPASVYYHQVVAKHKYLYAIAGMTDTGYTSAVRFARTMADGSLGGWTETTPLHEPCARHAAVLSGSTIYVSGGVVPADGKFAAQSAVRCAQIGTDGSLGTWQTLAPLPEPTCDHAMIVHDGFIYCICVGNADGGYRANAPIYSAPILVDGLLGPWRPVTVLESLAPCSKAAVATEDRLYFLDSCKGVLSAPFAPDGGLGDWRKETAFPYGARGASALAHSGSIYVTGGWQVFTRSDTWYPDVYQLGISDATYRAIPDSAGRIAAWEVLPGTPTGNQYRTSAAISGDNIYLVGGTAAPDHSGDWLPTNKVFFSRLHTSDTPLPTVSGGRYVGMFRLERDEPMVSLHWSGDFGEGSGAEVRWRAATEADPVFGPWSEFSAANQIPIGRTASCLQYEVRLTGANGNPAAVEAIRLVTDTAPPQIVINPTPSILWPANGRLVPVTINGSATDTESGVASVSFTITDEYGQPYEQVTDFGQTVQLQASRMGNDRDGRVYTVTVRAADHAGNDATATASIVCPHDLASIGNPRR